MKILAIGDVCGAPGVDFLCARLGALRRDTAADLVVVNGENACIRGITPAYAERIFSAGADVITLGNHTYDNRQICSFLDDRRDIIRPANMPSQRPGTGYCLADCGGRRVCVVNLIGQVNMDFHATSPFAAINRIMSEIDADFFVVDFHAEATSEKQAMAHYLDGRAAALWGTHTHVQTADARVFPGGLGFIADLGMTGGLNGIIGVKAEQSLATFLGDLTPRFEAADGDMAIQGALFELGPDLKCCTVTPVNHR